MVQCHSNGLWSVLLDRPPASTSGSNSRHCSPFSAAALRRIILDAISCGSSSYCHQKHTKGKNQAAEAGAIDEAKANEDSISGTLETEKLSDLLNCVELRKCEVDADTKRKEEEFEKLKRVANQLQAESEEERRTAAFSVRKFAKEAAEVRTTLALLGVIPPLVRMLDLEDQQSQVASLYALLNLGIKNDENKSAILTAGAVGKMIKLIESPNPPSPDVSEAIVANFLGLTALDSNKQVIGSSGAIPFLVKTLKNLDGKSSSQAKQDALRALYNLSICGLNISVILETDLILYLLNTLGDMEISERILSILSNVVSTLEGRRAIGVAPDAFPILVDVLNWIDSPGCQEKVSYILMVMAHKAYGYRQAMIGAGIVSSLLELTLLGSPLAQKRASRILKHLRVDKEKQVSESCGRNLGGAISAPIIGSLSTQESLEDDDDMMSEEKKAVKQLVQQSLQNNMRRIVKRANLPQDFVPSEHFKSLSSSSTSKSVPF